MKFTLEIDLGNDAMRDWQDVRDVLRQTIMRVGARTNSHNQPTAGDGAKVLDENGNWVGYWYVSEHATVRCELFGTGFVQTTQSHP